LFAATAVCGINQDNILMFAQKLIRLNNEKATETEICIDYNL